jgi:ribA/ribD-fused uncharacterized protein
MKYLFFWKQTEKPYGCFSNWYISHFTLDGIKFNCVEQYMMWKKAKLFNDDAKANEILSVLNPWEHKAKGREVKNFDVNTWDKICKKVVYDACKAKFEQNPDLLDILLDTDGKILVEASPTDIIWGIGLSADDKRALIKDTWRGKNYLGEVLTKLRDDLI